MKLALHLAGTAGAAMFLWYRIQEVLRDGNPDERGSAVAKAVVFAFAIMAAVWI